MVWCCGTGREWLARVSHELDGALIEADLGIARIVGTRIDVEDVLHVPAEFGILLRRDAPLLLQVRGQPVFF